MTRAVLRLPKGQLDLFRITTPAAAGSVRAAALPSSANSLTADARRQGGSRGPASERESAIHTARVLIGEASRRRAQHAFHAWLLRAAANQRRCAAGLDYQRESGQLDLFGGAPHGR